jgi:hypothetical protein
MLKKGFPVFVILFFVAFSSLQTFAQSPQVDPAVNRLSNTYFSFLIEWEGNALPEGTAHLFNPQLLNVKQTAWKNQKVEDGYMHDKSKVSAYNYPVEIMHEKRKAKTLDMNGKAVKGEVITLTLKQKNNSKPSGSIQLFKIAETGQVIIYNTGTL